MASLAIAAPVDSKLLTKRFQEAQTTQLKSLQSHETAQLKQLRKDQKSRQDQFDRKENEDRHKYFAEARPGTEKRAYIKSLLSRRGDFQKQLADERNQAKAESDRRIEALKLEQAGQRAKFKEQLDRGVRPDDALWPQPGISTN